MKIVSIGSGNVASHMALAFKAAGHEVIQVWSKSMEHATVLANQLNALAINRTELIDPNADLYLIAVKDDAIADIAHELKHIQGLVVHTSGAVSIAVLSSLTNYGVLYPLQTFSKNKVLNFSTVPLCLEAKDETILTVLKSLAAQLTSSVSVINSEKRKVLHVAAVFANNFTNHLFHLSQQILESHQLNFDLLKPLILETAAKVQGDKLPAVLQTGPAVRADFATMERHLAFFKEEPKLTEIYTILSDSIKKTHS